MTTHENNRVAGNAGKVTGRFKGSLLRGLKIAGFLAAFLLVGLTIMSSLSLEQISNLDQSLMDMSIGFLLFRWAAFLALMFYWRGVIAWLGRKKQWSEAHLGNIINNRWQVIALFITLELIFNHRSYLSALS